MKKIIIHKYYNDLVKKNKIFVEFINTLYIMKHLEF